ncbi:hypothetical protein Q3W71_13595 [Micromonospora sp. C28SCA-DRY-2]|uniref:hypothetical protein n=1 Tax=Micromonospora sp. C28SCA-DRY-2 TaxID=3059522 RepID=UPI0026760F6C|nr:hypothetical protein [Micromonospora sp. C28SCA-DRY-2]MDO3702702.1 hypothetical protein [Micromonospora sp. C28SCA-DRY-2]
MNEEEELSTASEVGLDAAPELAGAEDRTVKKLRHRRQRRIAKALLYAALIVAALFILAEPWLLLPVGIAAVAVSLWD